MANDMNPDLHAQLLERAQHRTQRLATALNPQAPFPDVVIAMFAEQVLMTLTQLVGPPLFKAVLDNLFDQVTESYGVCRFCHERAMRDKGVMCQQCWDQAEADDAAE